jgi:hypothetical protein
MCSIKNTFGTFMHIFLQSFFHKFCHQSRIMVTCYLCESFFLLKCNVKTIWFVSDSGFVILQGTSYWTDLFVRHFLFQTEHCIDCDDLLFFVRKRHVKGSSRYLPKFEVNFSVIVRSKLVLQ